MAEADALNLQLETARQAQAKFEEGQRLIKAKQYKEALDCLLFAFDNGHLVAGWGGVRLSYVPSTIADLGEVYEPATLALRERRDAREKLIEAGEQNFDLVHEWTALCRYLDDHEHLLSFIDRLAEKGALRQELKAQVVSETKGLMLERREYRRLGEFLNKFVWSFLLDIARYQAERDFPTRYRERRSMFLSLDRTIIKRKGIECFEIALGCRRRAAAEKICAYLTSLFPDAKVYEELAKAAERTGQKSVQDKMRKASKRAATAKIRSRKPRR